MAGRIAFFCYLQSAKSVIVYAMQERMFCKTKKKGQKNMIKRKWKHLLVYMLILLFSLTGCNAMDISSTEADAAQQNEEPIQTQEEAQADSAHASLTVHYLDVGQGNAILAESEGHYMLIDGGARESSSFVVHYLKEQKIEKLDYILISHFDEDHLAGAIGALYNFPVDTLITPDYETDSAIYRSYEKAVKEKSYEALHPKVGEQFAFGAAKFRIISPVSYGHEDENQDSVGIILENGKNRFFIGGDIGLESEKEILDAGTEIKADVMLMNHHGFHVSRRFFEQVSPSYCVISCGADNSYGHPRQDTVSLIKEEQVPLFRTDKQGTIILHSDGNSISFEQEPCNDYTPGQRGASGGQEESGENPDILNNSDAQNCDYILNIHTKKIHRPDCTSVKNMNEENRAYYKGDIQMLRESGYTDCGSCKP